MKKKQDLSIQSKKIRQSGDVSLDKELLPLPNDIRGSRSPAFQAREPINQAVSYEEHPFSQQIIGGEGATCIGCQSVQGQGLVSTYLCRPRVGLALKGRAGVVSHQSHCCQNCSKPCRQHIDSQSCYSSR